MSLPASHISRDHHTDSNNLGLPDNSKRRRRNSGFNIGTWSRGRSGSTNPSSSSGGGTGKRGSNLSSVFAPAMNMMRARSKSPNPSASAGSPGGPAGGAEKRAQRTPVAEMERLSLRGGGGGVDLYDNQLDVRDRDRHASLRSHSAAVPLPGSISTTPSAVDKRRCVLWNAPKHGCPRFYLAFVALKTILRGHVIQDNPHLSLNIVKT